MRASALALALGACGLACGAPPDTTLGEREEPVKHGQPELGRRSVVALVSSRLTCGGPSPDAYCSGTLIAPRVVLTAAHCLEQRRFGNIGVVVGRDVRAPDATIAVVDARVHPAFDPATREHDLALLVLDAPAAPTPTPLATSLPAAFVGAKVAVAGFGVSDDGTTGALRSGVAVVSSVDATSFRYTPGPAMTCGGDSGGPVFFDDAGVERLVGVTRSGDAACVEFGTAVRFDADLVDFVKPVVDAAATFAAVPLDTDRDHCAVPCVDDLSCPPAMLCLEQRGIGKRCGFAGLQSGRFGPACNDAAGCSAGTCVSLMHGADGACRCFVPCTTTTTTASLPAELEGGCDVGAGTRQRATGGGSFFTAVSMIWIAAFFRRRASSSAISARRR